MAFPAARQGSGGPLQAKQNVASGRGRGEAKIIQEPQTAASRRDPGISYAFGYLKEAL